MSYNSLVDASTSFYALGEASGSRADYQGANALTANGSPGNLAAVFGNGANLDSSSKYLTSASTDFYPGSDDFTATGWFRLISPLASNAACLVFGKYNSSGANDRCWGMQIQDLSGPNEGTTYWRAFLSTNGTAAIVLGNSSGPGVSDATRPSTDWHHWALVRDGTDLRLYIDGVLEDSNTVSGALFNNSTVPFRINGMGTSGNQAQSAEADDFGWWNGTALTVGEIGELVAGPEPSYVSGASFGSDGAFNVGTWELLTCDNLTDNGSITYSVVAVEADGTEVDTASAASGTLDLSSAAGETVYLMVRLSNSGGFDVGDHGTRTPVWGSANDGYYELASVTAAGGGGPTIKQTLSRIEFGEVAGLHAIGAGV